MLWGTFSTSPFYRRAITGLGTDGWGRASLIRVDVGGAFVFEVILTALFVLVVLRVTSATANAATAAIAIGLALTVVHLVGIPVTGTSVNPARSLGPALVVGGSALNQVWLFIMAPLVGGALAAGLHRLLYREEDITLAAEARLASRPGCPVTNADHCRVADGPASSSPAEDDTARRPGLIRSGHADPAVHTPGSPGRHHRRRGADRARCSRARQLPVAAVGSAHLLGGQPDPRPLFKLLSLPLILVTLGLFLLVVNAALLEITAALTSHLDIGNFWSAVLGGSLIALFSWLAELLLPLFGRKKRSRRRAPAENSA